jgi:hypothetical protein
MKTNSKLSINRPAAILFAVIGFLFYSTSINAQDIQVKGIVKGKSEDVIEILSGANVYIKGTTIATSTNKKGEFTFPRKLKAGEILIFSYLGYEKKSVRIRPNTTFLSVILEEDDNEILGAPMSNKRFKSKRNKQ